MNLVGLCLGLLAIFGCLNIRQVPPVNKLITITIKEHRPYCGGAPPPKEIEGGFISSLIDQEFYIKKGIIHNQEVPVLAKMTTDSTGRFSIGLDTGLYLLIFPEKQTDFEEFYQLLSKEGNMLKPGPIDCFRAWWKRPDATFQITDTTLNIECIIRSTCHAEFNPCMYYTGPKRP